MLSLALCALLSSPALQSNNEQQLWRAHLNVAKSDESQIAQLDFGLDLVKLENGEWTAFLVNEPERIPVPNVTWDGQRLDLSIDHYDSRIQAELGEDGVLRGNWSKVRGKGKLAVVPFWAESGPLPNVIRAAVMPRSVDGRWDVKFADDEHRSVGIFKQKGANISGTFLNATGDFRYLAGSVQGTQLKLSCFDGAHAFLFEAEIDNEGNLAGSFRSGNWWLDSWTGRPDAGVEMTDSFQQTTWDHDSSLAELNFLDEKGQLRSLIEPGFLGKATILQLFGTWCPNCHDETRYLVELHGRYAERGLRIVGLAFELADDFERDIKQLGVFKKRHNVPYPMLLAGTANKAEATLAFPAIDRLRSFPTSIFIDSTGRIRGLHSGFSGPATGDEHTKLRAHYESWIETLLNEEPAPQAAANARLDGTLWQQPGGQLRVEFALDAEGLLQATHSPMTELGTLETRKETPANVTSPVHLRGDALWFGGQAWRLDERVGSLAQTRDFGRRLFQVGAPASAVVRQLGGASTADLLHLVANPDASRPEIMRVEALMILASRKLQVDSEAEQLVAALKDSSHSIRMAALHAIGAAQYKPAIETVREHLSHPNAAERRQAVNALIQLGVITPQLKSDCMELWPLMGVRMREMYPKGS